MNDFETSEAMARLSVPDHNEWSVSRRRFLQLALAGGVVASTPPLLLAGGPEAEAVPLGPSDGVLIVVLMAGGNDGLNTLVPYNDGTYHDRYGSLAFGGDQVLPINGSLGLHRNLLGVKSRFDAGKVALIQGVGYNPPNLSHFESMATWMSGWAGGITNTGWLGRYLAGLGDPEPFTGIVFGDSVPLHFHGPTKSALSLPDKINRAIGWLPPEPGDIDLDMQALLRRYDDQGHERGPWANAWNATMDDLIELGGRTQAGYAPPLPGDALIRKFALAARMVNLNLGSRVIGITYGDFDTHANQAGRHDELLRRFDRGVDTFFANLDPAWAGRATILTMSEFGRRPKQNSGAGSDHGAASVLMAIGGRVNGGLYGGYPSLTDLDSSGSLKANVDFRTVYATVLESWLGADATQLLGANFGNLGFMQAPTDAPTDTGPGGAPVWPGPTYVGPPSAYTALPPARVLDTRPGSEVGYSGGKPGAGAIVVLPIAGVVGVPADDVSAVVLNVTATEADEAGYVTVWHDGPPPLASNLNLEHPGQTRPNLVSVPVGPDGAVRLFTYRGAHLIADVFGYYTPADSASAGRLQPLRPARILDTRADTQIGYSGGKPGTDAIVTLAVAGQGGVPGVGAGAVVLNVTATESDAAGFVTVWPEGPLPLASNLNVERAGQTIPNQVIVPIGSDGAVRLYTYRGTHLVADVVGWFTDGSAPRSSSGLFVPVSLNRVMDTRFGIRPTAGGTTQLPLGGYGGVPGDGASAVALNVTVTGAEAAGYVTVWPDGAAPLASSVNVEGPGQTIPNHVVTPLGSDGSVQIFTYAGTHLVADVAGYFT